MALLDFTRTTGRSVAAADRVHGFFSGAIASIIAWNDARRTRAALSSLTPHELDDIGLTAGDIDAIANGRRA